MADGVKEILVAVIEKAFPHVQEDGFELFEYSNGCLFHFVKWNETRIGEYINDNYEKGITRLLTAIEQGDFAGDERQYANHLLAALSVEYYDRGSKVPQNKKGVFCRLFTQKETFKQVLKTYAVYEPKALAMLLFFAFTRLNVDIIKFIAEDCVSKFSHEDDCYSVFISTLRSEFIGCEFNISRLSEENCNEYLSLCVYIDERFPELHFKTHHAYEVFDLASQGLKDLLTLQPMFDKIEQGIFWINTENLPAYIEFDYIYPNGKNGDILKYILEEYGETSIKSGVLWHGKIAKEYIEYFDIFYMAKPLTFISEDSEFINIFNYHIPTIITNRLKEPEVQRANCFKRFREYMDNTLLYYKERTKKRTEVYSQLILQGQTSPKWKSEAQLFALVSSIYPDAIYQYRSDWLESQSLDVFIPSISVGIEYQGVQHYKPIEYFGGEEHFKHQQENDKKKRMLCKRNGIILMEWPYNEKISKKVLEKNLKTILEK